ncbi:MAG: hypothetical protein NVSMB52_12160 [Chloroflexota bacterium]
MILRLSCFLLSILLLSYTVLPWANAGPVLGRNLDFNPHPGVSTFLKLESSTPVFEVLYRYGRNDPAGNGAYGANISAPPTAWFLEEQRAGGIDVMDGVLRHPFDPSLVAVGLKTFRFGLSREDRSGRFSGSAWPFHGTAMFLSEAAPSLLALKASPLGARFATEISWDTHRMRNAAYAMVREVGGHGKIDDTTKNHRWYEAALALGSVGILANDTTLENWSRAYALHATKLERSDGVMPENGGHDSGYQALGMVNAARYIVLLARGTLRSTMLRALRRAEAWELSRIGSNGSVNQQGDTRTANCREHSPAGQCKGALYAPIFSALAHWAVLSGDAYFARAARNVWTYSGYGSH